MVVSPALVAKVTWRARAYLALVALALPAGGYLAGRLRRSPPPPSSPPPAVVAAASAHAESHAAQSVQGTATKHRAKAVHRVSKVTTAPDGTKTRQTTTDTFTDSSQAAQLAAQAQGSAVADRQSLQVVCPPRDETRRSISPTWLFGLAAGRQVLGGDDKRWWVGGTATHAFVGPLRWGALIIGRQGPSLDLGVVVEVEIP